MKRNIFGLLVILASLSICLGADDSPRLVTVPRVYATNEGGGGSSVLRDAIRLQNVYSSRLFPSNKVLVIRELRYRPSAVWGDAFSTRIADLRINLSTTRAGVGQLSATFADNVGANDTVVFDGPIDVSSSYCGPKNGPKEFDIIIPLSTPFRYNPARGNLLIDYRNRSGSSASNIDAGVNNGASRVFALGADSTVAHSVDQGAEVVQLIVTEEEPEPEPPSSEGLIIPPAYATQDAGGGSSLLQDSIRLQNVYSAALFPSNKVLTIRELRYRPSAVWGSAFSTTISNIQINLSATHAAVGGLSATFADNVGANDTLVFNGSVNISSAFSGPAGGPKAFDIIVPLSTPFRYSPAEGNLLIDYRNRSGSGASSIDAGHNNGASRAFALGADSTVAQSVDLGAEVVQVIYAEDERPDSRLVIPKTAENTEMPYGSGTFVDRALRNQQVYESVEFPQHSMLIHELRFRPDSTYGRAFVATVSNIQINLSTTPKSLNELSSTYSQNVGADDTIVFQGPLSISSQFVGPTSGPKAFDIVVPLSRPFLYNPTLGSLVVDVRNFSGSSASRVGGQTGPDRAGRVVGSLGSTAGLVDTGADAIQIVYSTGTNQPPPAVGHDLSRGFAIEAGNPNGVWSYGWQGTLGGAFNLFTHSKYNYDPSGNPVEVWDKPHSVPAVMHNNGTNTVVTDGGQGNFPPETTWFYPGVEGQPENFGVIRFTVANGSDGTYRLGTGVRRAYDGSVQGDTDFHVLRNGVELFSRNLSAGASAGYTNTLALASGDTIDFVIGRGADNSFHGSGLKIQARLNRTGTNDGVAPTVVSQPTNQTVVTGGTARFTVSASGTAPLNYQWHKDSTPILGAMSAILTLTNVQLSDAGNYSVLVNNAFGSVTSQAATLTVNAAPPQVDYDLSRDFAIAAGNPNGAWSYGWQGTLGGPFTPFTHSKYNYDSAGVPIEVWDKPDSVPAVQHNNSGSTAVTPFNGNYPPETTWFYPGVEGYPENYGVIRFTVPSGRSGTYNLATRVAPVWDSSYQRDTDFHVLRNGVEVFGRALNGLATAGYTNTLTLAAGDTIDFVIGRGADNSYIGSGLKIAATLGLTSPTAQLIALSSVASGSFKLAFTATRAGSYIVEVSTDLINWNLLTSVVSDGGLVEIIDPQAGTTSQRYYRARLAP